MTKIDKNWRIRCATGDEMNQVWKVLIDAGESMYTSRPYYDEDQQRGFRVMLFEKSWMGGICESNITFKEFMKLMKLEDRKEGVQYVTNLLDYLDKPELIQHKDGTNIRALHYFPDNEEYSQVVVVFENGITGSYHRNGKYFSKASTSNFILKPKEKKIVRGWRRALIYCDGTIRQPRFYPSKDTFNKKFRCFPGNFGPWEEGVVEVCDD